MKSYVLSLGLSACSLLSACTNPEERYDEFANGKNETGDSDGPLHDANEASDLEPEQIEGTYLYVVSTIVAPRIPTIYLAQIEAEKEGRKITLRIRQRPLSKVDRSTPVAPWGEWHEDVLDSDGEIDSPPLRTIVPAEANAITGFDTESEISMHGRLFDVAAQDPGARIDFFCGALTGRILSPFPIDDLSGSTFTGSRIESVDDPKSWPPVVINCDREPARPL